MGCRSLYAVVVMPQYSARNLIPRGEKAREGLARTEDEGLVPWRHVAAVVESSHPSLSVRFAYGLSPLGGESFSEVTGLGDAAGRCGSGGCSGESEPGSRAWGA